MDLNATCLELLTFIHGTAADYDVGQAATFELSLQVHEHVYYLSCPELVENDAVGLQGNPILLRIAVDDADMVHYRSQISDDYVIFKGQKHISSLTL